MLPAPNALLREGRLSEALAAMQDQVRKNPADGGLRFALASFLALSGQWERCATQLSVFLEMTPSAAVMARLYQSHLQCELFRRDVFAGRKTPLLLGEPQAWMASLIQALKAQQAEAVELRAAAFEEAQTSSGSIDELPFEWIADADPRLGPCLELYLNNAYYWTSFSNVRSLRMKPPVDSIDLVWMPVTIGWVNGSESAAYIPVRYPGSEAHGDPLIQLGRRTEFIEQDGISIACVGQRMWAFDAGERSMLETRQIEVSTGA